MVVISEKISPVWWLYKKKCLQYGGYIRKKSPQYGGYIRKNLSSMVVVSEKISPVWWVYKKKSLKYGGYIKKKSHQYGGYIKKNSQYGGYIRNILCRECTSGWICMCACAYCFWSHACLTDGTGYLAVNCYVKAVNDKLYNTISLSLWHCLSFLLLISLCLSWYLCVALFLLGIKASLSASSTTNYTMKVQEQSPPSHCRKS